VDEVQRESPRSRREPEVVKAVVTRPGRLRSHQGAEGCDGNDEGRRVMMEASWVGLGPIRPSALM
jgi:hypothetical protein